LYDLMVHVLFTIKPCKIMPVYKDFPMQEIIGLRGMVFDSLELEDKPGGVSGDKIITMHLKRDMRFSVSYCPDCGKVAPRERRIIKLIRDLPILNHDTYLSCEIFNVKCPECGVRRERLDFVDRCSRLTIRFEQFIFSLVCMSTVKDAAKRFELSWETVKNIDKKNLEAKYKNIDYGDLRRIAIDEISNRKGHDYLTIVMDLDLGRVIWVGEGRKEEDLDKFFLTLTKKQSKAIVAASMDMWPAYIKSVEKNCPNADIVFDKFHVVKKFGEIITALRTSEYKKADEQKDKDILKGTKWLLLRNRANLKNDAKKELRELLDLNENLSTAYILKEKLATIWNYKNRVWAKKAIDEWIKIAEESEIRGMKKFTKMLKRHEYGILNHCQQPISNGKMEGTNNKIKVLKHRCYGFHDVEYFKLKILEACQGKKV